MPALALSWRHFSSPTRKSSLMNTLLLAICLLSAGTPDPSNPMEPIFTPLSSESRQWLFSSAKDNEYPVRIRVEIHVWALHQFGPEWTNDLVVRPPQVPAPPDINVVRQGVQAILEEPSGRHFDAGVLLVSMVALDTTNTHELQSFTGLERSFIAQCKRNLKRTPNAKGGEHIRKRKFMPDWGGHAGGVRFVLDVNTAVGGNSVKP